MKRVMVNFDDETGRMVETRAKAERRSMSAHLILLAERDLKQSGAVPATAELAAAVEEVGGPRAALEILQQSRCPTRRKRALKKAA